MNNLNEYQKLAVINNSKSCIVKANVGSGKTTVLVSKIEYLLENDKCNFEDMVILTFTNKAANEIKTRIMKNEKIKSKIQENKEYLCGTFHSVALDLLKNKLNISKLGFTKDFSIITPEEEEEFAQNIIFQNKLKIKYASKIGKRLENARVGKSKYGNMKQDDEVHKLLEILDNEKIKENKMSFDDLLEYSNKLLPEIEKNYKWIIVDEFQDCNEEELKFINNLKSENTKLFVVGDPNQVIYSWRGSQKNIFDTFAKETDAEIISLPINYRSNETILKLASNVIKNANNLEGINKEKNKIIVNKHYDEFNEAEYLKDKIMQMIDGNNTYKDFAILYRTRNQSKVLEDVFKKNEIPYEVKKRETVEDIPVLDWFIRLLKTSINIQDISNLKKVYINSRYGFDSTNSKVMKMVDEQNDEYYNCILKFSTWAKNEKDSTNLYKYFDLDSRLMPTSSYYAQDKLWVEKFLNKLEAYIDEEKSKNININLYDSIIEFLNMSSLYDINFLDDKKEDNNTVKLMTLHSSKGLEFKNVFIIGANQGLIPIKCTKDELEEERRLFFVGITRAMNFLEISYYENPGLPRIKNEITEFLNDVSDEIIEIKGNNEKENNLLLLKKLVLQDIDKKQENVKKVKHEKYGIGIVKSEDSIFINVEFEKYGLKEFVKGLVELIDV